MENPAGRTPAERLIAAAIREHATAEHRGVIGISLTRRIYRKLVEAGHIAEKEDAT